MIGKQGSWKRSANDREQDGFSLIELCVVMVIIGVIAAIAIPIFLGQRRVSWAASAKSDLHLLADEENTYYVDNSTYVAATGTAVSATAPVAAMPWKAAVGPDNSVLSSGNYVSAQSAGLKGYCIVMSNIGSTQVYVWDSLLGGLQPNSTTTCQSGNPY